jgi:hypothetical protein
MQFWHWLVIQPVKAYFATFFKLLKSKLVEMIKTRHLPAFFDDYVTAVNKYGLILPIGPDIAAVMPFSCRLLTLNTFSEQKMLNYLEDDEGTIQF